MVTLKLLMLLVGMPSYGVILWMVGVSTRSILFTYAGSGALRPRYYGCGFKPSKLGVLSACVRFLVLGLWYQ